VVVFNENIVKVCEQYLKKGAKVYVEGAIQTRKWTDQAGVEKFSTEIVLQKFRGELTMLDGRGEGAGEGEAGGYNGGFSSGPRAAPSSAPREDFSADLDDEIPF
jgi:single-strand DNA-binding protein